MKYKNIIHLFVFYKIIASQDSSSIKGTVDYTKKIDVVFPFIAPTDGILYQSPNLGVPASTIILVARDTSGIFCAIFDLKSSIC